MVPEDPKAALRARFSGVPLDAEGDARLALHVLKHPACAGADTVFCFVGMSGEVDTRPLLRGLLAAGKRVCVPVSLPKGRMKLRRLNALEELTGRDRYGIPVPPEDAEELDADSVDLALVPGVCFGPDGSRLGRGGGYYDRFLSEFRGTALGLCRGGQITGHIPMGRHDRRVDAVITPDGVLTQNG